MAKVSLILGESGSGKSRSIKGLPPKRTFVINVADKELPFKGSSALYPAYNPLTNQGNMLTCDDVQTIADTIKYVTDTRPEISFVVIDDNQYLSLFTYTSRINEKDWAKFNTIAFNMVELVKSLKKYIRPDVQIFMLNHIEEAESALGKQQIQAKTLGKFVKEKVTYEGLFTVVLLTDKEEGDKGELKHFFWTRRANSTVKSPEGMFIEQKIDNDLLEVAKAIHGYYN